MGGLFVGVVVVAAVVLDVDVVEQVVGEIIISPLGPSFEKKGFSLCLISARYRCIYKGILRHG